VGLDQVNNQKDEGGRRGQETHAGHETHEGANGISHPDVFGAIPHQRIADGIEVSLEGTGQAGKNPKVPNEGETGDQQKPNLTGRKNAEFLWDALKTAREEETNEKSRRQAEDEDPEEYSQEGRSIQEF